MTWYLQVINMMDSITGKINGDLANPFFYSRTSCCGFAGTAENISSDFDVLYPDTLEFGLNVSQIAACDLPRYPSEEWEESRAQPLWSHSRYCPSFEYVRFYSQQLWAWRNSLIGIVGMVVLPVGAGLSDTFGRN
jgi:hypothetical protein